MAKEAATQNRLRILNLIVVLAIFLGALALVLGSEMLSDYAIHPPRKGDPRSDSEHASAIARQSHSSVESVNIHAPDGVVLHAWWLVPAHPSGKVVFVLHGIADSSISALGFAPLFLGHGYAVLAPDSRGHGQSGGIATYGVLESHDLVEWANWVRQKSASNAMFGLGESLGGSIVLQSLRAGAPFRAVVAECAYASFKEIARERLRRSGHIPVLPSLIVFTGMEYVKVRYGVDLSQANTVAAVAGAHVPMLLIHGLADDRTSPENSRELAAANPRWTQLWLVPGAGHTGAYKTAPAEFERRVLAWFDTPDMSRATLKEGHDYAPAGAVR